jgi:hypothetical protein
MATCRSWHSTDRAVTDPFLRQRAADLGAKIQAENGLANAERVIGSIEQDTSKIASEQQA